MHCLDLETWEASGKQTSVEDIRGLLGAGRPKTSSFPVSSVKHRLEGPSMELGPPETIAYLGIYSC